MKIEDAKVGMKVRDLEFKSEGTIERVSREDYEIVVRYVIKGRTSFCEFDPDDIEVVPSVGVAKLADVAGLLGTDGGER